MHVDRSSSREDGVGCHQAAADLSALSLSRPPQTELTFVICFSQPPAMLCREKGIIEAGMRRLNSDALSLITNGPLGLI